jgi:ribosomal protein S18 acetylase RimI-like enzyme
MVIADYEAVIGLWANTSAMLLREADSKENINTYLKRNPNLSFVCTIDDHIVGAILVGTDGRRGYVQHLAVDNKYRGQGLGKSLISAAVSALEVINIAKTHLFVANDNVNAQKFYELLGWQRRDEVKMYSFNSSDSLNV